MTGYRRGAVPRVLAVDLDDVCADRLSMISAELAAEGISTSGRSPRTWDLSGWGVRDHDHFERLHYRAFVEHDGYARMAALPGAAATLRRLAAGGVRIRILTGRLWQRQLAQRTLVDTAGWLAEHDIPVDDIAFVTDKVAVAADVYLEDAPHFVKALRAAGRTVFTFHASYNVDIPGPRVREWSEVPALVSAVLPEHGDPP